MEELEEENRIGQIAEELRKIKDVNEPLKVIKEFFLEKISFKHSELENNKAKVVCDKCDLKANTCKYYDMTLKK